MKKRVIVNKHRGTARPYYLTRRSRYATGDCMSKDVKAPFGEMPTNVYNIYCEERQKYTQGEQDYSKILDKTLVTLAGGAIALSLAFLNDIVGEKPIVYPGLLLCAWLFLILAIIANVISIHLTPLAFREFRAVLDEEAEKGGQRYWTRVREGQKTKAKPKAINRLNWASLIAFLVGLVLMLLFAYTSVSRKEAVMPKESNPIKLTDNSTGVPLGSCPATAPVDRAGEVPDTRGLAPPSAPVDQVPPQPPSPPQSDD